VSQEDGYGIVKYSNTDVNTGFPQTLDEYKSLSAVFATANPAGTSMDAYTPSNSPPACPASASSWRLQPDAALPTIPGLKLETVTARTTLATGPGSQNTGAPGGGPAGAGLNGGAIVGIVVACVTVLAGLGAFAFFVWRRANKAKRSEKGGGASVDQGGKVELPVPVGSVVPRQEMDASGLGDKALVELESSHSPHEVSAYAEVEYRGGIRKGNEVYELDASGRPDRGLGEAP